MREAIVVLNAVTPGLDNLANLLDLLTDLTLDLGSSSDDGRGPEDRVHALAGACSSAVNEILADLVRLSEEAEPELPSVVSDEAILAAYRKAAPEGKAAVIRAMRLIGESEDKAKAATIRAETAEQQLRSATERLDVADRELAFLRSVVEMQEGMIANLQAEKAA
ncbi:MAG: hypothetical protein M9932_18185 [Xanthobacteraceae bacterium]|nr:hypothetical protein [Xanthobacteraceae bacterium]